MDSRLLQSLEVRGIDLGFESDVYIFSLPDDLSVTGIDAPVGSICVQTTGIYRKSGTNNTDWGKQSESGTIDGQVSVTANYTAAGSVAIFVDTTNNPVNITMGGGAGKVNKYYHIKWVAGPKKNRATILPASNETIDGESKLILQELMDSRNLIGHATGWYII